MNYSLEPKNQITGTVFDLIGIRYAQPFFEILLFSFKIIVDPDLLAGF